MEIRRERACDHQEVYKLIQASFSGAEHADGNEQDLVQALRKSSAFVPELSLVAVDDNRIIGHILFTEVRINNTVQLALAPLSVHPGYQRRGVGQALMREGHKLAAQMGYEFSVVLGSSGYYPKAGYVPADVYGIEPPFDVPRENFMALSLQGEAEPLHGMVMYAPEFFSV